MDRLTDADPDNRVEYWRQENVESQTIHGVDDILDARIDAEGRDIDPSDTDTPGIYVDRRDREHVCYYQTADGRWLPTPLKRDDHVTACGLPLVVIGPGSTRTVFLGYYAPWFGDMRLPVEVAYIEDRAPLDPAEPPMPVIPTPEVTP